MGWVGALGGVEGIVSKPDRPYVAGHTAGPTRLVTPGASTGPGEMALTRTPRPLSSFAQTRAKDRTAALDAAYRPNPSAPLSAAVEAFRMTEAPS